MTRTARSRLRSRLRQGRPRSPHNQRPATQHPRLSQPWPGNPRFCNAIPCRPVSQPVVAGSWIGHLLFGATDTSAGTTDAAEAGTTAGGFSSTGILFLMLLAAGVFYLLKSRRSSVPDFSGMTRTSAAGGSLLAEPSAATRPTATVDLAITSADQTAFQQLLVDMQTTWGKQDLAGLLRFVTPEMLAYFSTALAEDTSLDVANHVHDVVLLHAEVRETWTEDATQYATVGFRWSVRDYAVSLTKHRGEHGYLVEGSEETPIESGEVWTFMRYQNGKWLLFAIQQ